ncbi:hypothetical protein [Rhodopseudomonas pseudopalustris]|uniref:hypothetical protein n=1 Tax=Rhodopseudomonas pseudopalustris TaxID=1513892 RepID=UPI000B845327|nr:hypothetical protein [Rhodopseudomonas pseudopalustris]
MTQSKPSAAEPINREASDSNAPSGGAARRPERVAHAEASSGLGKNEHRDRKAERDQLQQGWDHRICSGRRKTNLSANN